MFPLCRGFRQTWSVHLQPANQDPDLVYSSVAVCKPQKETRRPEIEEAPVLLLQPHVNLSRCPIDLVSG